MQNTNFLLPQTVISSNGWTNPNNIFATDGSYTVANATPTLTSELVVGNFLFNIPSNSVVSGIEIQFNGKRGVSTSPASTLQIYAYDNTNDNNALYQYTPVFSDFDIVDGVYNLGSSIYTFGQTLTAEQVNNLKFKLIGNAEMYVTGFKVRAFYAEPEEYVDTWETESCQTIIQAQKFNLIDNVSSTSNQIIINKFETPDGVLITNADIDAFHVTQGKGIPITVSHATRREENMYVTNIEHLTSGYVRLDVTRGWSFKQPVGQNASRNKAHPAGNDVIISNSTPFYDEFLKNCHIGSRVSAPIKVEDENVNITNYLRKLNFKGAGVTATATPAITGGGHDVDVTITGYGNQPITIINTTSVTSGGNQVTNLSTNIESDGIDPALLVSVSLEAGKTVSSVTFNAVPLVFVGSQDQNDVRVEVWSLANPPAGNHTITTTFSAATYSCFEAMTLAGVDQTTPVIGATGNSGNSLTSTGSVTTLTTNSTFFHALATREVGMTYTAALGETINATSLSGAVQGGIASRLIGSPSVQNTQINLSISNDWANLLFAVQPTPVLPPIIAPSQQSIQFKDETINLGTSGTVDTVNFTGSGVVATRTGNTVDVTITGGVPSADELVKVSATDTTTGYLDNKIELVAGTNTTVTKTILNPGANEKIQYQVNSTGSTLTGEQLHLSIFNGEFAGAGGYQNIFFLNNVSDATTSTKKKYGTFGMSSPSAIFNTGINRAFCYDHSLGKWFHLAVTNTFSGNYTLRLSMGDKSDLSTETNFWTCAGFSSVSYPIFGVVVDLQELKLYVTFDNTFLGTNTIDTTTISAIATYVFDLSSATGGTIAGTPTLFTGANKFPNTINDIPQINSTTNKFITRDTDNKYTYNSSTGITSNIVVNYGDYSGKNIVHDSDVLHKDKTITFTGSSSGSPTIVFYVESSTYPDSNIVLNS